MIHPGAGTTTKRIAVLDIMRGLIMILLAAEACKLYESLEDLQLQGVPGRVVQQFSHHKWHGLRFWDLVQPAFMSMAGAALYISTTKGRNGFQGEKLISQPCCECCRTDLFVDSKNNIHVLYRGIIQDSIRDMVHAVSTDGGKTFSEPKQINDDHWVLNGCPHTGPAMTENKNGLHFAWYTGGGKVGSFYTRTTDNGKTFTGYDSISHVGRHPQLASMPGGELVIVWDETVTFQNSLNKRIGLQLRSATGMSLQTAFLTPDTDFSSYPVITSLDENSSVIAYCKKSKDKTYIMCQQVLLTSTPG